MNLGQYLAGGDPIVTVQAMDPVYVTFSLPQQELARLKVGGAVTVKAEGLTGPEPVGRITALDAVVSEATRNVQVQATFSNGRGHLRPGMYVNVQVTTGAGKPVIALPTTSINYAPYGNSVFIVEDIKGPDGKPYKGVRQQFVKVGTALGDQVAILDGVKPGQEVVTSGVFKLRTGASVIVNNAVQPGNSLAPKPEDS